MVLCSTDMYLERYRKLYPNRTSPTVVIRQRKSGWNLTVYYDGGEEELYKDEVSRQLILNQAAELLGDKIRRQMDRYVFSQLMSNLYTGYK